MIVLMNEKKSLGSHGQEVSLMAVFDLPGEGRIVSRCFRETLLDSPIEHRQGESVRGESVRRQCIRRSVQIETRRDRRTDPLDEH